MFIRYRALFALRELKTTEAIVEMSKGLSSPNFSPLFRHEISFVMGQLGEDAMASVPYLMEAVRDTSNHEIVRHESAESLSAVCQSPEVMEFL
jgi:deoxyhypusine monooxygenase